MLHLYVRTLPEPAYQLTHAFKLHAEHFAVWNGPNIRASCPIPSLGAPSSVHTSLDRSPGQIHAQRHDCRLEGCRRCSSRPAPSCRSPRPRAQCHVRPVAPVHPLASALHVHNKASHDCLLTDTILN